MSALDPAALSAADAAPALAPAPPKPVQILFGSQTGNAEGLAKKLKVEAGKRGFAPTLTDMAKFDVSTLPKHSDLLIITSTWGEGDPPDNALGFWEGAQSGGSPAPGGFALLRARAGRS